MNKQELYNQVIAYFQETRPIAETELTYKDPFQLLIAVILSAQCTDKRVNMITPRLFQDFPTPEAMAASTPDVVYEYIRSVSYPNNKAKHLVKMAQMLVSDFHSQVPDSLEDLMKLPGVGRKTANVIQRPLATEKHLVKNLPQSLIGKTHHWLILHGRYICTARKPKCNECGLNGICKESLKIIH